MAAWDDFSYQAGIHGSCQQARHTGIAIAIPSSPGKNRLRRLRGVTVFRIRGASLTSLRIRGAASHHAQTDILADACAAADLQRIFHQFAANHDPFDIDLIVKYDQIGILAQSDTALDMINMHDAGRGSTGHFDNVDDGDTSAA